LKAADEGIGWKVKEEGIERKMAKDKGMEEKAEEEGTGWNAEDEGIGWNGRKIEEMDTMEEGSTESEGERQQAFDKTLGFTMTAPTTNNVAVQTPLSNAVAFTAPPTNSVSFTGPSMSENVAFARPTTNSVAFARPSTSNFVVFAAPTTNAVAFMRPTTSKNGAIAEDSAPDTVAPTPNIETAGPVLVSDEVEIAERREEGVERREEGVEEKWEYWLAEEWYAGVVYLKLFRKLWEKDGGEDSLTVWRWWIRKAAAYQLIDEPVDYRLLAYTELNGRQSWCVRFSS